MPSVVDLVWSFLRPTTTTSSRSRSSTTAPHPLSSYLPSAVTDQLSTLQDYFLPSYLKFNNPPPFLSLVLTLVAVVIAFRVFDYAWRWVMWWVTFGIKIVVYGGVLLGGWYVYTVGWETAMREAGWVWGLVEGFLTEGGRMVDRWGNDGGRGGGGYGRDRRQVPGQGRNHGNGWR